MQTFSKSERLSSKVIIDKLVKSGNSFNSAPFRITWLETVDAASPLQVVISVPKRSFKKAVDRNRLKRIIREAYRKNKNIIIEKQGDKKIILMFIYNIKTIITYKEIE